MNLFMMIVYYLFGFVKNSHLNGHNIYCKQAFECLKVSLSRWLL